MELQDQVRAASMQKLLAEHTRSHFEVKQCEPPQKLGTLGCQVESQGNARGEAQMRVIKASTAQTRYSCGLWAPRSIGLSTQNQAVADAGAEHFAVCSRSSCVASERRGNAGKVAKPCTTTQCKIPCTCVSRALTRPSKEACSAHSGVNAASLEVTLGKEMAARRNISRE